MQLPWGKETSDAIDIQKARAILDEDHYDLEKVKDRIIEYLAVGKLKKQLTGPILCFVGPPGVGKTSLGQSIARAMGRKFVRLSVGGVRDEAEIRGHRRTYIGAMPGTIVRALRDAGTSNPVMMIDEIDKVGSDFRGDPQSALLEVLDPEQNNSFRDHYLDLPFDLSHVLFICTANQLETISPPLRDRMEIITLSGYTELEKLQIAKRYLVQEAARSERPARLAGADQRHRDARGHQRLHARSRRSQPRARDRHDLPQGRAQDRRGAALQGARQAGKHRRLPLQKPRFYNEVNKRMASVGVATGLAWTPVGGDIMFIETTTMPGTGKLTLTGQLGDVMKESATAAVSFLRVALRGTRTARRLLRQARSAHPRSGRRRSEGRSVGGHLARDVDRVAADESQGRFEPRDDGRDHVDGSGAADRRPQGEGARREARRHLEDPVAEAQRDRSRRRARRKSATR